MTTTSTSTNRHAVQRAEALTRRQIARAICRSWGGLKDVWVERYGIAVVPVCYKIYGIAYDTRRVAREDIIAPPQLTVYNLGSRHPGYRWFDTPAEARLYVLRHIGIVLPS